MKYIEFDNYLRASFSFALEEYIMTNPEFDDEYFLFWRTDPTLMIGRFQNTIEEINSAFVKEHNIQVVRRNSGGGTVYTDPDCWQFSFITWKKDGKVKDFQTFTKPVVDALKQLGVDAQFSGRNDLLCDGKKFSGNARFSLKDRFLHHGTILFDTNLENLVRAITVGEEKIISKGIKSVRERVTNIRPYLKEDMDSLAFRDKMISMLRKDMEQITLSEKDIEKILEIEKSKFLTWEWNYGVSPAFNMSKSKRFDGGKVNVQLNVENGIIKEFGIFGDFFFDDEIQTLQNSLVGLRFEAEEIRKKLQELQTEKHFYLITIDQIIEVLFE
ncbi:MAG: lipoate--protein ligase [Bacteroidales bacterium]